MFEGMELPSRAFTKCKIRRIGEALDVKDSVAYFEFVDDKQWIAEHLAEEFRKRGLDVKANALRMHRAGTCICQDDDV